MKKLFTLLLAAIGAVNAMAASDDNIVKYDFENYKFVNVTFPKTQYYAWYELNDDQTENELWASGNPSFALALLVLPDKTPEAFPTVAVQEGYDGACVKLETKSTGTFGSKMHMGIAAGNLFTGTFDSNKATSAPMEATQFGKPFNKKPVKFTGYYKYAAGASMQDGDGNAVEGTDKGQIYSVLYRNEDASGNPIVLNGADILTNENIVAIADAGDITDVSDWTKFDVEFKYKEGKEIDEAVLKAGGYSMATVFTSSINGAAFIGAVGSTLYIDKVAIECETQGESQDETQGKAYTNTLIVDMNDTQSDPVDATIIVTKQENGKYTVSLRNFQLVSMGESMAVGTVTLTDVEGTEQDGSICLSSEQNILLKDGDDPEVDFWLAGSINQGFKNGIPVSITGVMTDERLDAVIDIDLSTIDMGVIHAYFGDKNVATGIGTVATVGTSNVPGVYSIGGAKANAMQQGAVYILRKADGTTVKVIKK